MSCGGAACVPLHPLSEARWRGGVRGGGAFVIASEAMEIRPGHAITLSALGALWLTPACPRSRGGSPVARPRSTKQIVVDDAPARRGRIDHAHAKRLDGGLLGGADPRYPARQFSRQRERAIVSRGDDGDLAGERADAVDRRREHVHVDVRRGEHDGADPLHGGVAVARIKLAQALEREHRAHAVRDDVDAAAARRRDEGQQHALEVVARPHRAFAVIGVVEQARLGRPGEHHRLAAKPDGIGEVRGVERRGLERLLEAVHVDQHVLSAGACASTSPAWPGMVSTVDAASRRARPRRARSGRRRAA